MSLPAERRDAPVNLRAEDLTFTPEKGIKDPTISLAQPDIVLNAFVLGQQSTQPEINRLRNKVIELEERDSLTGLYNHFGFTKRLQETLNEFCHLSGTQEEPNPPAVLVCDVDGFKRTNKLLGHIGGNIILQTVAQTLLESTRHEDSRPSDICARIGGDEFGLIIPDTSTSIVIEIARRICQTSRNFIRTRQLIHQPALYRRLLANEPGWSQTLSIGIAFAKPESTIERLIDQADLAMFKAKEKGIGKVVLYRPSFETGQKTPITKFCSLKGKQLFNIMPPHS